MSDRTTSYSTMGDYSPCQNLAMKTLSKSNLIHSDPDILGGIPVFMGTRVPVKTLLDYLEAGDSLNTFLDHFPCVKREQAIATLELAKEILTEYANLA